MNREYHIALQFVQTEYRELYNLAELIVLTPEKMFPPGQTGQCSSDNFINISDGIRTVGEFVDTLVHELTHARQNRDRAIMTEKQREEEAYAAGILAAQNYMVKAAPWSRRKV